MFRSFNPMSEKAMAPALANTLKTASSRPPAVGMVAMTKFKGLYAFAPEFNFSVLGKPPLSDIETRHDFQPGKDSPGHMFGHLGIFLADTVHSKTDAGFSGLGRRLDVNVRCVVPVGIDDDLVHQPNHLA
jgi:hypothetical protein